MIAIFYIFDQINVFGFFVRLEFFLTKSVTKITDIYNN